MNNKNVTPILFHVLIALVMVTNIVVALITKENTLLSYICCNVIAIIQTVTIIDTYFDRR